MHNILLPKGRCLESRNLFKFWERSDNISKMVQDRDTVAMEDIRNRMWLIEWHHCQRPSMTLKVTFAV